MLNLKQHEFNELIDTGRFQSFLQENGIDPENYISKRCTKTWDLIIEASFKPEEIIDLVETIEKEDENGVGFHSYADQGGLGSLPRAKSSKSSKKR